MNTIDKLVEIRHILTRRQTGSTTLMQRGSDRYDAPFFLVAHDMNYARQLARQNKNAVPVSYQHIDPSNLVGYNYPVCIDHHTLALILSEAKCQIDLESAKSAQFQKMLVGAEQKIETLRWHISFLNEQLQDYEFTPEYKKMLLYTLNGIAVFGFVVIGAALVALIYAAFSQMI